MPSLEEMEKKGMLHEYDSDIIRLKNAMDCNVSSESLEESYINSKRTIPEIGLPIVGFITSFSRKLFDITKLFIKVVINKTLNGIEWVIKFSENVDVSALEDIGMDYSNLENMGEEKKSRGERHYTNRQRKNQKKHKTRQTQKTKIIIVEGVKIEVPVEKKRKRRKANTTTTKKRSTPPRHEETIFDRIERMGS